MTGLQSLHDAMESFYQSAKDPQPRISLGLPFIDDNTNGGLAKAEVAFFLAYSGIGKTYLGLGALAANPTVPAVMFSLEMASRSVGARIASMKTGTPTWELEQRAIHDVRPPELTHTANAFPHLLIDDTSDLSIKDMHSRIKDATNKLGKPVRLVVIDYLELVGGNGMLGKSEQVDRIAIKVRSLAKDNDCSVVVLHQVAKGDGSAGHQPLQLDSGRFGGHQVADLVVGMYAPKANRDLSVVDRERVEEELYVQILKNRITGKDHVQGVRHTKSKITGRIEPVGKPTIYPGGGFQPDLLTPQPQRYSDDRYGDRDYDDQEPF